VNEYFEHNISVFLELVFYHHKLDFKFCRIPLSEKRMENQAH